MVHKLSTKKHKGSRKHMKGGTTTGEHGIQVYGNTNAQVAVGNGSNVIKMNVPMEPVKQMAGGRKMKGGEGIMDTLTNYFKPTDNSDAAAPVAPVVEPAPAPVPSQVAPDVPVPQATPVAPRSQEEDDEEIEEIMDSISGGKKKRKAKKSAKKQRKTNKKRKTAKRTRVSKRR